MKKVVERLQSSLSPEMLIEEYLDIICSLLRGDKQFLWALNKEAEEGSEDADNVQSGNDEKERQFIYPNDEIEGPGFRLDKMRCGHRDFSETQNRQVLDRVAEELRE